MKDAHKKISAFLSEYLDIYGEDIFVDPGKLKELPVDSDDETAPVSQSIPSSTESHSFI